MIIVRTREGLVLRYSRATFVEQGDKMSRLYDDVKKTTWYATVVHESGIIFESGMAEPEVTQQRELFE